jgi:hypothetical protein
MFRSFLCVFVIAPQLLHASDMPLSRVRVNILKKDTYIHKSMVRSDEDRKQFIESSFLIPVYCPESPLPLSHTLADLHTYINKKYPHTSVSISYDCETDANRELIR